MDAVNSIILGEDTGGKGRVFQSRFLQAGLVKYSFGVCLLTKETINKFVNSFIGCPVRINHKDITDENAKDERVGVVSDIWFNDNDGWFWCKGVIFDDKAIELINNGYTVSCQYEITEYSDNIENKLHNGIPYDKEILNGKFEHLAIVDNPRYEGALIAVNALMASNDKWITIKPNGEENTGKHLLLKKGESPYDAIRRVYGDRNQKQLFDTSPYKKHKEDYKREREEEERRGQEAQEKHEQVVEEEKEKQKTNAPKSYGKVYDNLLNNPSVIKHLWESVKAQKADNPNAKVGDTAIDSDRLISHYTDGLSTQEYREFNWEKAEDLLFEKLHQMEEDYGFKSEKAKEKSEEGEEKLLPIHSEQELAEVTPTLKYLSKGVKTVEDIQEERKKNPQLFDNPYMRNDNNVIELIKQYKDLKENPYRYKGQSNYKELKSRYGHLIDRNEKTGETKVNTSEGWKTLFKGDTIQLDDKNKLQIKKMGEKATNGYKPILDYIENYDERNDKMNEETKNVFERLISALKAKNEADEKDKKAENEEVDKRDIIRQIMAIAGKEEASEDVKTIAKLAEKLAYDKSEAGTADNKAKNEDDKKEDKEADNCRAKNDKVDKRELIDQVGGILKGKVDDEIIRTIIGKLEEIAYDKSEAGTADNKAKNDDDEYKKLKDDVEKDVENCKAKNSMEALKDLFFEGEVKQAKSYMSQKERIELGKQLF